MKPAKLHFWVRQQIDTGNQEPVTKETQYGVLWDEPNSYFGRPKLS